LFDGLDDAIELGDRQQLTKSRRRVRKLDERPLADGRRVRLHDGAKHEAVGSGELTDVQDDVIAPVAQQEPDAIGERMRLRPIASIIARTSTTIGGFGSLMTESTGLYWAFMRPIALALIALLVATADAAPQRRGRFNYYGAIGPNPSYDGAFMFCRIAFNNASNGDGGGWFVDYPRADTNLSFRFSELTAATVSRDVAGNFNHAVYRLTDAEIDHCPFIMMTEPGGTYFSPEEAQHLRSYLEHGGFLWADDFWGEYAWAHWENEIRKALPSAEFPLMDVPLDHPIFHVLYDVREVPQIPSIGFWFGTGGRTSERGADSAVVHARAITDREGHMLVFMTHNTDFGDAFEREGENRAYFDQFAAPGYAVGVNVLLYALTH